MYDGLTGALRRTMPVGLPFVEPVARERGEKEKKGALP